MIINKHINISNTIQLTELILELNKLSQQAEDNQAVVILRLESCSCKLNDFSIQDINRWEQAVRRIERLPSAVIAVASGRITGPAFDLLLATDYRFASTDFHLTMTHSEDGLVWPGMTMHRLVNQIGLSRSRSIIFGSQQLSSKQAVDLGIVDEISNTEQDILAAASRLLSISGSELALRRQLMFDAMTTTFEEAIGTHLAACDRELRRHGGKQTKIMETN